MQPAVRELPALRRWKMVLSAVCSALAILLLTCKVDNPAYKAPRKVCSDRIPCPGGLRCMDGFCLAITDVGSSADGAVGDGGAGDAGAANLCSAVIQRFTRRVFELAAARRRTCGGDGDCQLVAPALDCPALHLNECPVAVQAHQVGAFREAVAGLAGELCLPGAPACWAEVRCPTGIVPRCVRGECTEGSTAP